MIPAETMPRAATAARPVSRRLPWGTMLVRWTVPAAVWAASASLATFAEAGGVETAFLGCWAAAVLAVVAGVAPAPARELLGGAVLATLILWVLPPDPTRSAALGLLLVAVLALATFRAWPQWVTGTLGRRTLTAVGLALGWHSIYASGAFATGELSLPSLLAGPFLTGLAVVFLIPIHGPERVGVAAAAVLVACQGFGPVVGISLAALALAEGLRNRLGRRRSSGDPSRLAAPRTAASWTVAPWPAAPWAVALVATGVLFLLLIVAPLVQSFDGPWAGDPHWTARAFQGPLILPLLLPAAFLAALGRSRAGHPRWPVLITLGSAWIMAWIVTWAVPNGPPGWLVWPVTLVALTLPRPESEGPARHAPLLDLQRSWSGLLVLGAAVPAAYPWLRGRGPGEPWSVEVALTPLGLSSGTGLEVWPVLGVLVTMAGLALLASWDRRLPAAIPVALAALLVVFHLPPAPLAVETNGGRVLTVDSPSWHLELPGQAAGSVILDTLLAHSATLPRGTPVARVILEEADGRSTEWQLATGLDTGEWAAARPDVAAHPGGVAPPPWVSWLERDTTTSEAGGGGRFLAQRYRTRLTLDSPHPGDRLNPSRLTVTRRDDLPREVQLTLFHGEVRP